MWRTRRGRPVCHAVFGEATAVLAAFALQNRAFELLAEGWPGAPAEIHRLRLARDLAGAIGMDGMIAGQAADLAMTDQPVNLEQGAHKVASTSGRRAASSLRV